ncbi:metalloregulator ArsR/SmtB family transcription factor [Chiayiivirga flava]|uniref:DNA-binding transcriptional ArsR family regulator n=1 Tax=Chiayiivirga flava TaxID=659595 RepID=A0A7W8D4S9_9GAMM|nr:metalloregulator ArsR/SmtB family transcription factor [Chiayiivirga flava]MBB5207928.1 DNA-binding transcriptional ArsR family regulator [Chiayiivirga flava]
MVTQQQSGAVFAAIADPTRRAILDLLRRQELRAGDLARHFPVSRPAIARHIGVLRRAGLLHERRQAQARLYSLDAAALASVDRWLAPYRLFWSARLSDLKRAIEADIDLSS